MGPSAVEQVRPVQEHSESSSSESIAPYAPPDDLEQPGPNAISPNSGLTLTLNADSLIICEAEPQDRSGRRCSCQYICCCGLWGSHASQRDWSIPLFNILCAEVKHGWLTINYAESTSKTDVAARSARYRVDDDKASTTQAQAWTGLLIKKAYGKAQRQKDMKMLINPAGGKGHAQRLYYSEVEPILSAARCVVDVVVTTHQGHAAEIAEKVDVSTCDAIAVCSGDGLVNEVFNGLARRDDSRDALTRIAVGHIPCGSGNAMSWNLWGTGSVSMAALCLVKGLRTPLDLASITQGNKRTLSFLSQSFGIVAEADLGTDHLRWMGSARFTLGFLTRLIGKTVYPCDLAVKVEIDDKQAIKEHYDSYVKDETHVNYRAPYEQESSPGLPSLLYGTVNDELPEGWELIPQEKIGNFYCGNMAFMSADANFFPACLPCDGLLDLIMINGDIPRKTALSMLLAVQKGTLFDMPEVSVRKISGYRLIPRQKEGYISIDGERIPFEPFQVEVHRGIGTVLSRSGYKYEAWGVTGSDVH